MHIKILKNFLFFTFMFLLLNFLNTSYAKKIPYLHLKIRLILISDSTIIGSLSTKLIPHKNFNFSYQHLKIKKIKLHRRYIKSSLLKNLSVKRKTTLYITFKKHINYEIFPVNVFSNFFPLPKEPFTYEIIFKVPKNKKVFILIPSEKVKILKKRYYTVYIFKNPHPVINPCLIMTKIRPESLSFNYENLRVKFYYLPYNKNFFEKIKIFWEKIIKNWQILNNLGEKSYLFKNIFVFLDNSFKDELNFANILLLNSAILNKPEKFLHYLTEKKFKSAFFLKDEEDLLIEGLIDYFIDYKLSQDKKAFRKKLLIFNKDKAKAFFYVFEIVQKIGEKRFLQNLKVFYKKNFLTPQKFETFVKSLKNFYPEKLKNFPDFSKFKKVSIEAQVNSVKKTLSKYIIKFTLKTDANRSLRISLKIDCNNMEYLYKITLSNSTQKIQLFSKEEPKGIYIDPDYFLWRKISPKEIPISIAHLFQKPGILVYSSEDFPIYREVINFFKDLGYKSFNSKQNTLNQAFQNIIYFGKSPFPWILNSSEEGFYFKVIPNPYNNKGLIGFIMSSSMEETKNAVKLLPDLIDYCEMIVKSGNIIFKRLDQPINGIYIPVKRSFYIMGSNNYLSLEDLVYQLIDNQIILLGENKEDASSYTEFYQKFLNKFLRINSNFIIAVDLDPAIQTYLDKYLKSEITLEDVFKFLDSKYLDIKVDTLKEILKWAKNNNIKVISIGVDSKLLQMVLEKGLLNLSKKEMLKLPEMDLFNPSYKNYLFKKFQNSPIYKNFIFENFYQAQILKRESLAEHITKLLNKFKNIQIIIFTDEEKVKYPWGIGISLKKRNINNFKTIILNSQTKLNSNLADYLIGGEKPPPTN